jgi:oligoendopeptidase F
MMRLNDYVSAIFRQIACFKFEQELHHTFRQIGYLSYLEIGTIFQKHMKDYMGEAVIQSKGAENWWVYWGHIRTFFYVYSYASGLLIAKHIQNQIRKDHSFVEQLKYFMSAGRSESPKQIFKNMGMDIEDPNFWKTGLLEIKTLLNETEKLAKKLNKIS